MKNWINKWIIKLEYNRIKDIEKGEDGWSKII